MTGDLRDGGDDLQLAAVAQAVLEVDLDDTLVQPWGGAVASLHGWEHAYGILLESGRTKLIKERSLRPTSHRYVIHLNPPVGAQKNGNAARPG